MSRDIEFAKLFFDNKQYQRAKEIFLNNDMLYEAGLCTLLEGNIKNTRLIWNEIKSPCSASAWGFIVLDILENKPDIKNPGYFQIRSFLEVYINLFLENELYDWADALINSYKFFTRINGETPKFLARVLYSWGYYKLVHQFCDLTKKICYFDPEAHFIEAETYMMENDVKMAYFAINEAIGTAPEYYPALQFKNRILETGFSPENENE